MAFDYYHTDEDRIGNANVYNGQNSTLWVNFREAFPDKIQETYQELRKEKLTYEKLINQFITLGSDKWSESIYNEDGDFKYMSMLRESGDATNLPQIRGTGEEHLRYFIENRLNFCDSKWYAGSYPDDIAVVRIYTPVDENNVPLTDLVVPANADITITPFSHMYAGVRYKANGTLYQERVEANQVITFEAPDEVFNDTETAVYGASQISSFGDLSPLYLGYVDVSKATKLIELIIGNSTPGYHNGNLYHLAVGTNRLLKKIDIQNCGGKYKQALNLTGCPNIEEIYAKGSDITGVDLPDSGYLKIMQLPNTVANITIKNQPYLNDFSLEGYNNVKTIHIENCPTIDTLDLLDKCENVERVRLTDVNWNHPDAGLLYELIDRNIKGIDENNTNTDFMWVDGKCHIDYLTGEQYAYIKSKYPYLDITYGTLESQLIFMTHDGETELIRQSVFNAGDGVCPVTNGDIETPTKESTAQYDFTHAGWSLIPNGDVDPDALKRVEADRIVYAAYSSTIRNYTVNFYVDGVIKETYTVPYGGTATYVGGTPTSQYEYLEFIGWSPSPEGITGHTNCYAQWYDNREITDDWETIAQACLDGTAVSKYAIGSYKNLDITYEDGTTETIPMEVADHNHDALVDGVNKWEYVGQFNAFNYILVVYNDRIHMLTKHASPDCHFIYDGTSWTQSDPLPYNAIHGSAVVLNNKIHLLGGYDNPTPHYTYDGTNWTEIIVGDGTFEPKNCIVFNNEIHSFNGNDHYKWDGLETSTWTKVSESPNGAGSNVVYNGEIHKLGGNNKKAHYKYNGSEWILLDTELPYDCSGYITVYNGEIHMFGCKNDSEHYKYDGVEWTKLDNLPKKFYNFVPVVYRNEIHLIAGGEHSYHYKWSTSSWETIHTHNNIGSQLRCIYKLDAKLYILDQWDYVAWDGKTLTHISSPTNYKWDTSLGNGVYYNGDIYAFGLNNDNNKKFYKYVNDEWIEFGETPVSLHNSPKVVYNNEIHCIGGWPNTYGHYKYDGINWTKVTDLPTSGWFISAGIYNNRLYAVLQGDRKLYEWVNEEWTAITDTPLTAVPSSSNVLFDDDMGIYVINDKKIYSYVDSEWVYKGLISNNDTEYKARVLYNGQIVSISGTNIYKLTNPKATLTFVAKNLLKDDKEANEYANRYFLGDAFYYNHGGWQNSTLRTWLNNDLFSTLPTSLQNSMALVKKISDNGAYDPKLNTTEDKLWTLSLSEIALDNNKVFDGQGETYPIFTDNTSRKRSKVLDDTYRNYWLRSSVNSGAHSWSACGGFGGYKAEYSYGLFPILIGFCI